jgi:hypothetical protein
VKICVKFRNGVLFPKERGRGTGRNRRTEITFGRVEIFGAEIYLAKQRSVENRKMRLFGVSAASGRRREGGEEGQKRWM